VRELRLATLLAIGLALLAVQVEAQKRTRPRPGPRIDYTNFSHATHVTKEKLACASCHKFPTSNWKDVRKGDGAFPDVAEFPEHASCLNCHRQQFFARERPAPRICSNCHVKATPIDTVRYPFPSLGEPFFTTAKAAGFASEFRVFFPHDKHEDAGACDDCHKTHHGAFKTRPFTHATCFTCHNQESELAPLPANCDSCHKEGSTQKLVADFDEKAASTMEAKDWWSLTAARNRVSAGAFKHEVHADLELKCTQCHQMASLNTTIDETQKVPVKSCGGAEGCHVTATLDDGGALNYEIDERKKSASFVCTKCHVAFGNKAAPASHVSAIPKPATPKAASPQTAAPTVFAHAVFEPQATNYSQFKHDNPKHARLPCLLCHRRESNAAQPTLPGKDAHAPCAGCHAQQFANKQSEICTICHTDVQSGKVKAFPALRSFDARFDHAKHTSVGAGCATCHGRNRGGAGLTIPARMNAHVTCFSCHTPTAKVNGRDISSCGTCHQLGNLVRVSDQAAAYRVGFSHAKHDASENLACGACHRVRAGFPRGRQVSAPSPLNHHAPAGASSCATCHNGQRAFGGDDFSDCKRCHKGPAWRF
jgi:c(7)-type cytochrome triheme protein